MTLRQAYEYALIESNKLKAPSMLLEDYIYLFNKAIQQKVNEIYNRFDINQQSSDDLRVLQTTAKLSKSSGDYFELPDDYLHILNCMAVFEGVSTRSEQCGLSYLKEVKYPCRRMTADLEAGLLNNYYLKPAVNRPYYYLVTDSVAVDQALNKKQENQSSEDRDIDTLFKDSGDRNTNPTKATIKLEYGESERWAPKELIVTYLRSPRYVTMTEEDLWAFEDNTPVLEFPDYMCYEIINTYVKLLFENMSDPRLQTNMAVNQSIAVSGNK